MPAVERTQLKVLHKASLGITHDRQSMEHRQTAAACADGSVFHVSKAIIRGPNATTLTPRHRRVGKADTACYGVVCSSVCFCETDGVQSIEKKKMYGR